MSPARRSDGQAGSDALGLADIYAIEDRAPDRREALEDVRSEDWRNILVVGRATADGVHPETLALVGRARFLADELGCRVEVLLVGTTLDQAVEALKHYAIETIYRAKAPDYASIEHTAKVVETVVRKRRPELVLVFQSRTGDAVTAYTANRLGVGFVIGASGLEIDTAGRRATVTHPGPQGFRIVTQMTEYPQFVSVQRGLFRAPMEDPYAHVRVHDLDVDVGDIAAVEVVARRPPLERGLERARCVVVVGARVRSVEEVELAKELAQRLGAVFGVTIGIVERGLMQTDQVVDDRHIRIRPRLLVTVGVRGSLDFLQAIEGEPTIAAIGCHMDDPIAKRATYVVEGEVEAAVRGVLDAL